MENRVSDFTGDHAAAPPGWKNIVLAEPDSFISLIGPFWAIKDDDGIRFGFRVERRHCNSHGVCHGGMIVSFIDTMLPTIARLTDNEEKATPTVSLSTEFIAAVALGSWVEARVEIVQRSDELLFARCLVTADDVLAAQGSGTFRVLNKKHPTDHAAILRLLTAQE